MKINESLIIFLRKIRVAITPRQWNLKAKLSNGAVVYGKNRKGYGSRYIYIFRDLIEPEFQHLEKFLDTSGVFVDVGANTGIYTLKTAKHFNNKGIVLAIEPFPEVLASLFYSVKLNNFINVRLRNLCIGEFTKPVNFWMNFNKPNSFSLIKRDKKASYLSTLTVTLDNLFIWEGLDSLDYIKIDVEGAEKQVIAGAKKIIEKYRPIIQVEVSIVDVPNEFQDYSTFRAPNSPNKLFIPNESNKINVPERLGWAQVD